MCLAFHPCWTGQPHRIRYLDEVLDYILSHDGVWQTTAGEIADYYYAALLRPASWRTCAGCRADPTDDSDASRRTAPEWTTSTTTGRRS